MASAIELKSPNGAETLRIEHSTDISKTVNAYRLIQKGDHGIGDGAFEIINNNFNDSSTECSFIKNNNAVAALNYPTFPGAVSTTPFVGVNINHTGNLGLQILGNVNSSTEPRLALRSKVDAIFSSWYELYTQRSAVGAVSQSAGMPTGALIERNFNANGEYARFADGTQICYFTGSVSVASLATSLMTFTLPVTFSGTAIPLASIREVFSGGAAGSLQIKNVALNPTNTQCQVALYNGYGSTLTPTTSVIVIGKWFG